MRSPWIAAIALAGVLDTTGALGSDDPYKDYGFCAGVEVRKLLTPLAAAGATINRGHISLAIVAAEEPCSAELILAMGAAVMEFDLTPSEARLWFRSILFEAFAKELGMPL